MIHNLVNLHLTKFRAGCSFDEKAHPLDIEKMGSFVFGTSWLAHPVLLG